MLERRLHSDLLKKQLEKQPFGLNYNIDSPTGDSQPIRHRFLELDKVFARGSQMHICNKKQLSRV